MRVIVTGATGFVGNHVCHRLVERGERVFACVRRRESQCGLPYGVETVPIPDISRATSWQIKEALPDVDAVVHLAARNDFAGGPRGNQAADAFHATNVQGTLRIAEAAAMRGARRFVYLSSIKAVGDGASSVYDERTCCRPRCDYGRSKYEGERQLLSLIRNNCIEPVILRPPLVYGPGVGKSFLQLLSLVNRGWPLPLAAIRNARSFVYIDNLVDAISVSLKHPTAAREVFHIADAHPLSTPELIHAIARHQGKPARLFPLPRQILSGVGVLLGRQEAIGRLTSSLAVSIQKAQKVLDWRPRISTDEGIRATVNWFAVHDAKPASPNHGRCASGSEIRPRAAA